MDYGSRWISETPVALGVLHCMPLLRYSNTGDYQQQQKSAMRIPQIFIGIRRLRRATSGNAACLPLQAEYDVEVRTIVLSTSLSLILFKCQLKVQTKGDVQSVTTNITQIIGTIPDFADSSFDVADGVSDFWMQLASLSYETQVHFIGTTVVSTL